MAITERDAREVLKEAVEGKIVPQDEAEAYVLADKIDEVLAISEDPAAAIKAITGRPIDVLVYEFTTKEGRRVAGLTSRGIYALAAQRGGFETLDWKFERDGERLWCFVRVRDAHKGNIFIGVASQPLKMRLKSGEEVPDEFAFQKVTTKAERNALRKHLAAVEGIVQDFVLEQKRRGNALVVAAEVVEETAAPQKQPAAAAGGVTPQRLNELLELAKRAGVPHREVIQYAARKGFPQFDRIPAQVADEIEQWLQEKLKEQSGTEGQEEASSAQTAQAQPEAKAEPAQPDAQEDQGAAGGEQQRAAQTSSRSRRRKDDVPVSGNASRPTQNGPQQELL